MRTLIIMIAALAVYIADANCSAAQQTQATGPDTRKIVDPSIAATDRSWRSRARYKYMQREEDRQQAFDFKLIGEEIVNARPAYVLQATPHPGYRARGKYGGMFSKVQGKLWVDMEDYGWVKADGQVIQHFSIGLFLARVLPGSHMAIEQTRVGDGIWMRKHVEVRAAANILFIRSLVINKVVTYSG